MINRIFDILKSDDEPKWHTSSSLAKKINIENIKSENIEELLIDYYRNNVNSLIRYSSLPSKKNLEVLWGHIEKVGRRKLFDIYREDEHVEVNYLNNLEDERNIFLSHSFKDSNHVFDLARKLVSNGLNPWIAEAEINRGSHINNEVIDAIKKLPFFGILLSDNVLKSAWSAKEFEFAILKKKKLIAYINECEVDIIKSLNCNSDDFQNKPHFLLRKIFDNSLFSKKMEFYTFNSFKENKIKRIK